MSSSATKSKKQIRHEMELCHNYWHCNPAHYIRYGLFDKNLSTEELLDYIPPYYHYNFYMADKYEGVDTAYYSNKLNLYHLFTDKGIPTPQVIALVDHGVLKNTEKRPIDIQAFCDTLEKGRKYFFKPTNGQGGAGIQVFTSEVKSKDNLANLSDFLKRLKRNDIYIIQEGIEQHNDFLKINASSVNTLRMITQWRDGRPALSACVLRIAKDGKFVDNSCQGGLSLTINEKTGAFHAIATAEHGGGHYTKHPNSGFIFKNGKVENWASIRSLIISYAKLFPELKEIGWDVAVTSHGIQIIELNLNYGLDLLQCCCGGMRRKLNVYPKEL
ncbi:MAG: hypothetical protein LUF01_01950 [Bacteroides sp.]|nr:hypothetical protein [Bacteroides sp.]